MTGYDQRIDDIVIAYLDNNGGANFSQLLQEVGHLRKGISNKVLSSHLRKLEHDKLIRRDKASPGRDRFCYLTRLTRQQVSLGISIHIKSRREKRIFDFNTEDKAEGLGIKTKKTYQLLFYLASSGAGRLKHNSKPKPGDLVLYDAAGKLSTFSYYKINGTGVSDFSVHPQGIIGQAGALTDIDLPHSEIVNLFEMLLKQNPSLIKPIDKVRGEIRYGIADKGLSDYIADCWALFPFVLWRLEETWQYRRKPTKDEVEWYTFFFGKRKATNFFTIAQETRKRSKAEMTIKMSAIKRIQSWDSTIQHFLYGPSDKGGTYVGLYKKYAKNVMKTYRFPARVLLEMIYQVLARIARKEKDLGNM